MKQNVLDEEMEAPRAVGSGEIWIAGLCLGLSLLCGVLWVCLLIAPQLLRAIKI